MKPDKCKDDQVYLSVVDRGGYSIKDYLAEMSGSIPICISENVCSMEVLEMYLQEVLKDKHDLTIFAREENYFLNVCRWISLYFRKIGKCYVRL